MPSFILHHSLESVPRLDNTGVKVIRKFSQLCRLYILDNVYSRVIYRRHKTVIILVNSTVAVANAKVVYLVSIVVLLSPQINII